MIRQMLMAAVALGWASAADAAYTVTFTQTGAGVVADGTGSIDLNALTDTGVTSQTPSGVAPQIGYVALGSAGVDFLRNYTLASGPASFGTGGLTLATSFPGCLSALPRRASGSPSVRSGCRLVT